MADPAPELLPIASAFTPATEEFTRGATLRPNYVERNPAMWAVGETDMDALSVTSTVVTVAIAIGSFCLGIVVNILVSYGGAEKLTPMGDFMIHRCTWFFSGTALVFFLIGYYFHHRKGSLWTKL